MKPTNMLKGENVDFGKKPLIIINKIAISTTVKSSPIKRLPAEYVIMSCNKPKVLILT